MVACDTLTFMKARIFIPYFLDKAKFAKACVTRPPSPPTPEMKNRRERERERERGGGGEGEKERESACVSERL